MGKAMNTFERSQRRVLEDKQTELIMQQKNDAQAHCAKVARDLQNELKQLRDYKVLLRDLRKIRLDKLQVKLAADREGCQTRSCVRQMIRHGATRIIMKLESIGPPLEP